MLRPLLFALFLATLVVTPVFERAHAETLDPSCATDFRLDAPGGSLSGAFPEDQLFFNNCYAYSASTLVDAWMRSHPSGHRPGWTSPQFASVLEEFSGITNPFEVLEYVRQYGVCDESGFLRTTATGGVETPSQYRARLELAFAQIRKAWESPGRSNPSERRELAKWLRQKLMAGLFPLGTPLSDTWVDRALSHRSLDGVVQSIFAQACLLHMERPTLPEATHFSPKRAYVSAVINEIFNRFAGNRQPISAGVCGNMIRMRSRFAGFPDDASQEDLVRIFGEGLAGCGPHAFTIVGRRFNRVTQSCEFLIKNSWGRVCKFYRSLGFECEDKTGMFWLPEQDLNKGILELTYLGPSIYE